MRRAAPPEDDVIKATVLTLVLLHAADKPKLVITEFATAGGVDKQTASLLADAVGTEVKGRGFFSPLTANDVQTLLGLERQKQILGCSEESSACLTELAGALGAPNVLSGSVGRLGDAYQMNLQMLDAAKAQVVGRSTRIADSLEGLRAQIPYAVAEATGTPLPPPPSKLLPYSMIGLGGLAVVIGGVMETGAYTRHSELKAELDDPQRVLLSKRDYDAELKQISNQRNLGFAALGVGALLIGVGVVLMPADVARSGSTNVALTLGPSGVGLAGAFP